MKYVMLILVGICLISCKKNEKEEIAHLIGEWSGREILYPKNLNFVSLGKDTIYFPRKTYTIVTYVDSMGCTGCKLQLEQWKRFIIQLDSINNSSVLFFLHPKSRKEIDYILHKDHFFHPVCIDEKDSFNILNKFPDEMMFQTFLLDSTNKVIAIGNPVHNPKVKELYLKIVQGEKVERKDGSKIVQTNVGVVNNTASFGNFAWENKQKATFTLQNIGENPLVIENVSTSCGCTVVEYSKEPVRPGANIELHVTYKADRPEHFNKTITVYCNAESSPIKLTITGDAE